MCFGYLTTTENRDSLSKLRDKLVPRSLSKN